MHMTRWLSMSLFTLVTTLAVGCTSATTEATQARHDEGTESGPGDGGSCASILDRDCNPAEKSYTPDEIAACETQVQHDYDLCERAVGCASQQAVRDAACGAKPPEDAPERAQFEACLLASAAEYRTCLGIQGTDP
jgi:hypothetical protein